MTSYSERTFTSDDGLRLFYRDYGSPEQAAKAVLCIPGLTRNSRDFEDLAEHLIPDFRVLCADLRGRGQSEYASDPQSYNPAVYVRDMTLLLDAAGVEQAIFVGTSLGGLVTTMVVNMIRNRVQAAILNDIGPVVEPSGLQRIASYVGASGDYPTWDAAAAGMREQNLSVFPSFGDADWMRMAKRLCAECEDGTVRPDFDKNIAVPLAAGGDASTVDLWPLFEAFAGIPVLGVRGELSDILSSETFDAMKTRVPGLEQVLVRGVGHAPFLSEPEAVRAIDAFLGKIG